MKKPLELILKLEVNLVRVISSLQISPLEAPALGPFAKRFSRMEQNIEI